MCAILDKGPNEGVFNFSFKHKKKEEPSLEVGYLLIEASQVVPHGILVFFTSYTWL